MFRVAQRSVATRPPVHRDKFLAPTAPPARLTATGWPGRRPGRLLVLVAFAVTLGASTIPSRAEEPHHLLDLSLEEILRMEVTSAALKEERLSETAAAVYVITQEDIRRSGATRLPELLRMVPGLHVARIDAHRWAISARGFSQEFADKMLVQIDGRSVYTLLFSGVFWDMQDVVLEDIERIEVIRGPGATLWGSNAVNGVINIITKRANDTQGTLFMASSGAEEPWNTALRYGGRLGKRARGRIYAKSFSQDDSVFAGGSGGDGWDRAQLGFRLDWDLEGEDTLTVQGDLYDGNIDAVHNLTSLEPPYLEPVDFEFLLRGGNLVGQWRHVLSERSDLSLQLYYDSTERHEHNFRESRDTFDLDYHQRIAFGRQREMLWGFGYRHSADYLQGSFSLSFDPARRSDDVLHSFVQGTFSFRDRRGRLIAGAKLEHNDYTGFEVQPNLRLLWKIADGHSIWGAVSRAVQVPSRSHTSIRNNAAAFALDDDTVGVVALFGNPDQEAQELLAFEAGYRAQLSERFSIDVATFYNDYDNLRAATREPSFFEQEPAPVHLVIPVVFGNLMKGHAHGIEVASTWKVNRRWNLNGWYSWLGLDLTNARDADSIPVLGDDGTPAHQLHLRSYLNLTKNVAFDASMNYVGKMTNVEVGSYTRFDAQFTWYPIPTLEAGIGVRNVFDERHAEFLATPQRLPALLGVVSDPVAREIERSLYARVRLRL